MLFISVDDFYEKVAKLSRMSRQEEIECAIKMKDGDSLARERLIQSYLPMVASQIRWAPSDIRDLGLVLHCQLALEKAVDSFNFLQDSETFSHRLSWCLRQTVVKYLAK